MPDQRGVSISLIEPQLQAPPGVMHYESGPVTYRQFDHHGHPWLAIYRAEHDGVGWLVCKTAVRPLVLLPGDYVHCRGRVEEDHGDNVVVSFDYGNMKLTRPMPRKSIVHLEEGRYLEESRGNEAPAG